jgi:hypothetical protein
MPRGGYCCDYDQCAPNVCARFLEDLRGGGFELMRSWWRVTLIAVGALAASVLMSVPSSASTWSMSVPHFLFSFKGTGAVLDVSPNGRRILYWRSPLSKPTISPPEELYVYDARTGNTALVSTNDGTHVARYGADGGSFMGNNRVVFSALGPGLWPGVGLQSEQAYIKNLKTGGLRLLSPYSSGAPMSGGGVAGVVSTDVASGTLLLDAGEYTNHEYRYHEYLLSLDGSVPPQRIDYTYSGQGLTGKQWNWCGGGILASGGKQVAMTCIAANMTKRDTGHQSNCFMKNLTTGTVTLASIGPKGNLANDRVGSFCDSISPDGRRIAMTTYGTNWFHGHDGVVIKNLRTGAMTFTHAGEGDLAGNWTRMSARRYNATGQDVFVAQNLNGKHVQKLTYNRHGAPANDLVFGTAWTYDGRRFVFSTAATNLGHKHRRGHIDVYLNRSRQ